MDQQEQGRSLLFFLSKAYEQELNGAQIEKMQMKGRHMFDPHGLDDLGNPDLREGFELLTRSVSAMEGRNPREVQVELAAEYAGIFLGVGQIVSHPSEFSLL